MIKSVGRRHLVVLVTSGLACVLSGCSGDHEAVNRAPTVAVAVGSSPPDELVGVVLFATVGQPVGIATRPGDDRLFAIAQSGLVVPVSAAGVAGTPVLDISALTRADQEQGLLGMAFDPAAPLAYVDYTDLDGDTHIDEYRVGPDGLLDAASRRQLMMIDQPYRNHNGGQLAFGADGDLYIGMGDGGSAGDPQRRAIDTSVLLGKILRIQPQASEGQPYSIPNGNPFIDIPGARPEIWSIGLRNPWRFSFDVLTRDLWIADVGQNNWEEIDVGWADSGGGRADNYGWSAFEGTHRFNSDQPVDGAVPPIFEYSHGDAGCSISGGAVYRGSAIPDLQGLYVYGDYCAGNIMALTISNRRVDHQSPIGKATGVSAVQTGPDGELYVTSVESDSIYKIVPPK